MKFSLILFFVDLLAVITDDELDEVDQLRELTSIVNKYYGLARDSGELSKGNLTKEG